LVRCIACQECAGLGSTGQRSSENQPPDSRDMICANVVFAQTGGAVQRVVVHPACAASAFWPETGMKTLGAFAVASWPTDEFSVCGRGRAHHHRAGSTARKVGSRSIINIRYGVTRLQILLSRSKRFSRPADHERSWSASGFTSGLCAHAPPAGSPRPHNPIGNRPTAPLTGRTVGGANGATFG